MIPIARPLIGDEEKKAVLEVLSSGVLAQGPKVKEFEENFSRYIGTKHAIATSNGTTALHAALLACGVGEGDEVITTPFSFVASANSILYCGAKPVFADIDSKTFNIDPDKIKEKISQKTKAVLAVHLFGQPCDMKPILEMCEEKKLILIEDACQAHGAEYAGKKVGSFGDCAAFSFYPTKNMTTGEGGMITTDDKNIAEKTRLIREHGSKVRYHHDTLGYNYRMTDIAAAIGIEQLRKIEKMNKKRIENASAITKVVEKIKGLNPPFVLPKVKHVFHQYTIRVTRDFSVSRDKLRERLREKNIGSEVYYPIPIHKQELYMQSGYNVKCPAAENAAKEVLSLPVHPSLTKRDLELVVSSLKDISNSK